MNLFLLLAALVAERSSEAEPASEAFTFRSETYAVRNFVAVIDEPPPEYDPTPGSWWAGWHVCVPTVARRRRPVPSKRRRSNGKARARRQAQRRQYEARRRQQGRR